MPALRVALLWAPPNTSFEDPFMWQGEDTFPAAEFPPPPNYLSKTLFQDTFSSTNFRPARARKIGARIGTRCRLPIPNTAGVESQNRWDQKEEFDEQKGLEKIEEMTLIKKSARCVQIPCLKGTCCLKETDY